MTKKETIKIITLLYMAYPAMDKWSEKALQDMINIWHKFFLDDNYKLVEIAVQRHISTSKWMPNIAEIREQIAQLIRPDLIPPDEAWCTVKDYLYLRDCYIKLPPLIAKTVETIGTSVLKEQRDGYDKKMFMDLYEPAFNREMEKAKLPISLIKQIECIQQQFGGDFLKALTQVSEAKEKKEKMEFEASCGKYLYLDALPRSKEEVD